MEEIQPQGIPEEVLKDPRAYDLYKWGIWFVGFILAAIVLGVMILSMFGVIVSDMIGSVALLLAGALVSFIAGERTNNNG